MNRTLQVLNLIGIVLLIGLCAAQWDVNRRMHLRLLDAERIHTEEQGRIAEQEKSLKGYATDLDDFRDRVMAADAASKADAEKLKKVTAERAAAAAERNQWKAAYENADAAIKKWTAAVSDRDRALAAAGELAKKLAGDRNEAVTKYNDLVVKFNAAAGEIQKAADVIRTLIAQRNEAIGKFNDLAAKYNALVTNSGGAATRP
jgi:chromosome segregation ATPase